MPALKLSLLLLLLSCLIPGNRHASAQDTELQKRVEKLEQEVQLLRQELRMLQQQLQETSAGTLEDRELEQVQAMLEAFVQPDADLNQLSRKLQPAREDYNVLFESDFAAAAFETYDPYWQSGELLIKPRSSQTEVVVSRVSAEDLRVWNNRAQEVPGGYRKVARYFQGDFDIYSFKFVEPGEEYGMSFTGLIKVKGQWRLFPKLWRVEYPNP